MKKITREEWLTMSNEQGWNNIQKLQSELEALEGRKGRNGMTVEEIEDYLFLKFDGIPIAVRTELAKYIKPLTVPQGFTPDWSKAPEWANCVSLYWAKMHGSDRSFEGEAILFDAIPRPVPKTRERTDRELMEAWLEWKRIGRKEAGYEDSPFYSSQLLAEELVQGKSIKALCTAAGIPTTTEEV